METYEINKWFDSQVPKLEMTTIANHNWYIHEAIVNEILSK